MNYGYREDIIKDEDYRFGGAEVPDDILQPDSDWSLFLPDPEPQRKRIETMNCTGFGTDHALQALIDRKFGIRDNYSDRFTGIMAGTGDNGGSPQFVAEAIRKNGVIAENLLPFSDDIDTTEKYYQPNPMTPYFLGIGKSWLQKYVFYHQWVLTGKEQNQKILLQEALKHSPLGIAVHAWHEENGLYVKSEGEQDNHWVMLYAIDNKGYHIFDQYEPYQKTLSFDYTFTRAKRYFISKNQSPFVPNQKSYLIFLIQQALNIAQKIMDILTGKQKQEMRALIAKVAKEQKVDYATLCAVIKCESGLNPKAINKNKNGSTDYGIAQFNDHFWIGEGKLFSSPDYVLNNPEACIREMCKLWNKGHQDYWICYKTGAYKRFL